MADMKGKRMQHWVKVSLLMVVYDIFAINLSYAVALWMRFDCEFTAIPDKYMNSFLIYIPVHTICTILLFFLLDLYKSIWRFASINELLRVVIANAFSIGLNMLVMTLFIERMPVSYYFMGGILQFAMVLFVRFSYRFVRLMVHGNSKDGIDRPTRVMLIGAGEAGSMLISEINNSSHLNIKICCAIDDNPNKFGRIIHGVPIVGSRDDIFSNVQKYDIEQIFFAIPTASAEQKRDILSICKETDCEIKSLPGIFQLINGEVSVRQLKSVSIEELLGRAPVSVDLNQIISYVRDKVILVTGGGGSIGSELCRQIAQHLPKQLIIFDVYENTTYDIEQELRRRFPRLDLVTLIGSITDNDAVEALFCKYRPQIVYHAAAHKHVPLMENSPIEAVKNNVFGTLNVVRSAAKYSTQRFVMISTDKAVNPTNIMGATKRLCEMIIQTYDRSSDTEFVAVRFGNVLGSNGSVIPLFKKQIAAGGPVTVTHPDIIRYFMTIPEAVSLVLQAGAYANGGEIFILDMGDPVKIDDLARNLVKLSGHTPDVDIPIVYTGLRPGEKLYEEKLMAEEGLEKTDNQLIHIGKPIDIDSEKLAKDLEMLKTACDSGNDDIKELVAQVVPTYTIQ